MENEEMKEKKENKFIKYLVVLGIGALIMYAVIYNFPQQFSEVITKNETNVNITDTGLANSVEKIYDAVVVVSTYEDESLYSTGTGFVYKIEDDKAYILTNSHVIDGGDEVTVTLTNGETIKTNVIGNNPYEDVAVLTIDKDEALLVAQMGTSEDMKVGDTSFAVGAPLDSAYSWTVTRGIISGLDRMVLTEVNDESTYVMRVIQTDTAINNGNSGGPLCNVNGEVIGINTLKLKEEGIEGMGFAIPIDQALEIADQIINDEDFEQAKLGITMFDYYQAYANESFRSHLEDYEDNDLQSGIYVYSVENDSPADDGGLKKGDIITHLNGVSVPSEALFRNELYKNQPGDVIEITYKRDGKESTLKITLGSNESIR